MFMGCQIDGLPDDWKKAIEIYQYCAEHDIYIDEYEEHIEAGEEEGRYRIAGPVHIQLLLSNGYPSDRRWFGFRFSNVLMSF